MRVAADSRGVAYLVKQKFAGSAAALRVATISTCDARRRQCFALQVKTVEVSRMDAASQKGAKDEVALLCFPQPAWLPKDGQCKHVGRKFHSFQGGGWPTRTSSPTTMRFSRLAGEETGFRSFPFLDQRLAFVGTRQHVATLIESIYKVRNRVRNPHAIQTSVPDLRSRPCLETCSRPSVPDLVYVYLFLEY